MIRQILRWFPTLLFSVTCGAVAGLAAVVAKLPSPWPLLVGLAVGCGVLVWMCFRAVGKRTQAEDALPAFVADPLYQTPVSVHFFPFSLRGLYTLYVGADALCLYSPDAPASHRVEVLPKEEIALSLLCVSPLDEEPEVYDVVIYRDGSQLVQIHVGGRSREELIAKLKETGYFDAPVPTMYEAES